MPSTLQEVEVPKVGNLVCKAEYFPLSITAGMICAGESGKDSCQGDSGGPMVYFDSTGEPVSLTPFEVRPLAKHFFGDLKSIKSQKNWLIEGF